MKALTAFLAGIVLVLVVNARNDEDRIDRIERRTANPACPIDGEVPARVTADNGTFAAGDVICVRLEAFAAEVAP